MKRHLERGVLAVAVSSCLLASAPALAITNIEANAGPQFNFVNPGARSLGMGGAFVGLADDATAAYTNPAGLGQLSSKQWSIEGRYSNFSTRSVVRGRLEGPPTGFGLDTVSGLQTQTTDRSVDNLSFLAFALPLKHGTLAFYRHELANFQAGYASEGPFVQTFTLAGSAPAVSRAQPTLNEMDLKIVNYGFAGSWRIGSKFMLGGSLNYYQFDLNSLTRRYGFDADGDGTVSREERLTTIDFSQSALTGVLRQGGSDSSFSFNVGMYWQPNDAWSVGAVYRRGPTFKYRFSTAAVAAGTSHTLIDSTTNFNVPDVWAIGVGYRPSDSWRVSFDAARVKYGDYADHVVAQAFGGDIDYLRLNDGTELRLGTEYTALEAKHPYSLRFGLWHEPDHQMYFFGPIVPYVGVPLTPIEQEKNVHAAMFVRGKDAMHFSAGYGVVFDKFQLDAAVDISRPAKILSLSMVYFLK